MKVRPAGVFSGRFFGWRILAFCIIQGRGSAWKMRLKE